MHLLPLILALAVCTSDLHIILKIRGGRQIEGQIGLSSLQVKTDFGRAEIDAEHLQQIDFGTPDTVVTTGGVTIQGRVDLSRLEVSTADGPVQVPRASIASIAVLRPAGLIPGEITDGVARNRVTYHLRAPEEARPGQPLAAILILHGSNMNSRDYVATIAAAWPELAREYLLIGINGEQRAQSADGTPRYNYTYVNYVGRSSFKGYPGTDRESPALVAEVLRELKSAYPISRIFVGGHSQGGFLTYSLFMNEPELFAGAFPISAGLIIQAEPTAYEDVELRAAQRRIPIAIIHGRNDNVVPFNDGLAAYEAFEDDGFAMLRLITDDRAGHMFAHLPVSQAIRWLEALTSENPETVLAFADAAAEAGRWRDVSAALLRLDALPDAPTVAQQRRSLHDRLETAAAAAAAQLPPPGNATAPGDHHRPWVDAYLDFRAQFRDTAAAAQANAHFAALRHTQQPRADELFTQARQSYQRGDRDAGNELARTLMRECPASTRYRLVRRWIGE